MAGARAEDTGPPKGEVPGKALREEEGVLPPWPLIVSIWSSFGLTMTLKIMDVVVIFLEKVLQIITSKITSKKDPDFWMLFNIQNFWMLFSI